MANITNSKGRKEYDPRTPITINCEKCFERVDTTQEVFEFMRVKYGNFMCDKCEVEN